MTSTHGVTHSRARASRLAIAVLLAGGFLATQADARGGAHFGGGGFHGGGGGMHGGFHGPAMNVGPHYRPHPGPHPGPHPHPGPRPGPGPGPHPHPPGPPPHPPGPPPPRPYPYHPGYWPAPYYPGYYWGSAVGAAIEIGTLEYALPGGCAKVVVNGVSYEHCGETWYRPEYRGNSVVYVVVGDPR
ncbi:MAG: hypothetical protein JNK47_04510 [Mesorhizobium sp.]|nr:hypothetical protein [Mesorhizobium sp.]MBL8576465.1 hypothetical protein [Mesorhizobium sp.]